MDIPNIEILDDGVISVKTDKVSDANHISADELLLEMEDMMGGVRKTTKRERKDVRLAHSHKHVLRRRR